MNRIPKLAAWGCLFFLPLVSPAFSAVPSASVPATKPGAVVLDLTDPKKAYESAMAALMAENGPQVKACLALPANADTELVDAIVESQIAQHHAGTIILKHFGADGKRLLNSPMVFDEDIRQTLAKIQAIPATVTGDTAMLKSSPEPTSGMEITMRKVDGEWKLDTVRFLTSLPKDRDAYLSKTKAQTALLRRWADEIGKGTYKDVESAKSGMALLEIAADKGTATASSTLPGNRWHDKAAAPNLTALQKAAYEEMSHLQDCNLQQLSVPGAPSLDSPAPGTTDATVKLLKMGMDVVPILVEALDDTTPTKTSPLKRSANAPTQVWTVNLVVTHLICRICNRNFTIGNEPQTHDLSEVVQHPDLAPEFQKVILDWYNAHRNQTEVERWIDAVSDNNFRNRLDAVEWLGRNKVVKSGPAIALYIDRTFAAIEKQDDSLKESELSECAFALGQINDKENLPKVQQVCKCFSAWWDERHRPLGSMEIGNLFQAYHGMAMLGQKDAALKELKRIYDAYHAEMEAMSSEEFKSDLDGAALW